MIWFGVVNMKRVFNLIKIKLIIKFSFEKKNAVGFSIPICPNPFLLVHSFSFPPDANEVNKFNDQMADAEFSFILKFRYIIIPELSLINIKLEYFESFNN